MSTPNGDEMEASWPGRVAYKRALISRGYAATTVSQRLQFLDYLGADPVTCTREDIAKIIAKPGKTSSRRTYLQVMRSVFDDLISLGVVEQNPCVGIQLPRSQRGLPRPLTKVQVDSMLNHHRFRIRAWTILGCYAGLRAMEVVQVEPQHLTASDHGWMLHVPLGKGSKEGFIPAHQKVADLLLSVQPFEGRLWPLKSGYMSTLWADAAAELGLGTLRFHQCRHFFGTQALRASGNLLTTRDLMRHSTVATTEIYAKVADDAGFQAVAGF